MEPIRVLNMFTILNRGGAETMMMNYYRHIDRTKVQFDFLVHRQERGAYEDEIEKLGGNIYRTMPIYPQNFYIYQNKLREFFKEHEEYKIIHSHMSELSYLALKEAKKLGVPIRICHAHSSPRGFDLKMIMRQFFKIKMRAYITHMFMCSLNAGSWLFGEKNLNKCIRQRNAIDAKKFSFNIDISKKIKQELNIENKFVIGHVGRFFKPKNHDFIIDIFKTVYNENNKAVLLLVGDGPLKKNIEEKVSFWGLNDRVIFAGVRADVSSLLQSMDVFLFPSLFEGLPVTVIEAQAAGLNCIVSDTITQELNITGLVAYMSLQDSPEIWAKRILPYSQGYKRENTFEKIVKAGYDIKECAKWLEEFYLNTYRQVDQKNLMKLVRM